MENSDKKIMCAEDILKIFKEEEGWTILKHNTDIDFYGEDTDEDYYCCLDGSILSKKDIFEVYYEARCYFTIHKEIGMMTRRAELIDQIKIKTSEEIFYYDEEGDLITWTPNEIKDLLLKAKVVNGDFIYSLEIIIPSFADIQKEKANS